MKLAGGLLLILMLGACASTQPAADTAELASQQLLRLETELQNAADTLQSRYLQQQKFVDQNLEAALEAENGTNELRREWKVSGNREASRLYADLLTSRPTDLALPALVVPDVLTISTSTLKKAIKDLGSVNDSLVDRDIAEAYLRFGHQVNEDYQKLRESDEN